jgi:hypothetical protein
MTLNSLLIIELMANPTIKFPGVPKNIRYLYIFQINLLKDITLLGAIGLAYDKAKREIPGCQYCQRQDGRALILPFYMQKGSLFSKPSNKNEFGGKGYP